MKHGKGHQQSASSDPAGGYTIVSFVCIYFLAAYIRLYKVDLKLSVNVGLFVLGILVAFVWRVFELRIGRPLAAIYYQNPVIILMAVMYFMLFRRIKWNSQLINRVSSGCFTVYLLHSDLIAKFPIKEEIILGRQLLPEFLWRVIVIFGICVLLGMVYSFIEKKVFDFLEKYIKFYTIQI